MPPIRPDPVEPTTTATAFSCAHCGALTTQFWRSAKVEFRSDKNTLPMRFPDPEETKKAFVDTLEDDQAKRGMSDFIDRVASGLPSIGDRYTSYSQELTNVDVSECYNCHKLALWVGDRMVWPQGNEAPPPNVDLPDDVRTDYMEAGEIVSASPRGAAALLRLAIQKLCKHLGETGKNINADIAALVAKGLDLRVQKMLDVVRVIGNNAVHPGEIDIRDDRSTAEKLFILVNLIADIMISQPKTIEEMYGGLGDKALAAIAKRDGKEA
jgi:hypothetical protein